ncbi:hypothetical protein [Sphingobium sp. MK2]|uniref:hypothetical protein n=1 Tax=Sphingobium sp. MK2 TaxID=3116540 RepID=UPI0032E35E30
MSELYTIFSPTGEKFEVSLANFRDLSTEPGWSVSPIAIAAATVNEPVITETSDETVTDEPVTETDETTTEETAPKARVTVEDFADLTDKADVAAYISTAFPDAKIDGRANRDKLVAQAIELATPAE